MKYKIYIIASTLCFLGLIGGAFASPQPSAPASTSAEDQIEAWVDNHPRAASEFGTWIITYKEAARQILKWDSRHPEQTKLFVTWVTSHQGKGIDAFTAQHADWNRLNKIIKCHSAALSDFIVWCRFHPKATAALMQHPRALYLVGRHLYESS